MCAEPNAIQLLLLYSILCELLSPSLTSSIIAKYQLYLLLAFTYYLPITGLKFTSVHSHFNPDDWDRYGGVQLCLQDYVIAFLQALECATNSSTTVSAGE